MIRLGDAVVLAYTKLQTHRIRTGLTVGISGILFGIILAGVIIAQGVFASIERFSQEGLNDRSILAVTRMNDSFNVYQNLENADFINDVEARHLSVIAQKTVAAKKHSIPYNAKEEDPSPVLIDKTTGKKYIDYSDSSNAIVLAVARDYVAKNYKQFDIEGYLAPYKSARILNNNSRVQASNGASFSYMQNGTEEALRGLNEQINPADVIQPSLVILNQSVIDPFINESVSFDSSKGELPVIIPYGVAEKLLGLKKLPADSSTQTRYDRLNEVRSRIGEATASFCYRNAASLQLLGEAQSQWQDFEKNGSKADYVKPSVVYKQLSKTDCAAVEVEKDTRTAFQKDIENRYIAYQKEIGAYLGEPVQYKVTVRAVGISKDAPGGTDGGSLIDISGLAQSLLGSWLGFDQWVIPPDMLKQVPEQYRPADLFRLDEDLNSLPLGESGFMIEEYLVEFDDVTEARAAMKRSEATSFGQGEISAYPFGSSALLMDEAKDLFGKVVLWALIGVGGVAIIILGSMIGRTVAEGRRESAVFRAIGARRSDIGGIYTMYTILLSIRVALFALILGVFVAVVVEVLLSEQATLGARFAYASVDTPSEFHFFGIDTWYILAILGSIIVVGLIAAIIPIVRSTRRNPIKDMRDDT